MATRKVKSLRGLSYEERLRRTNLFTIEKRLSWKDIILAYSLFQGHLNVPLDEFLVAPAERNLRMNDFQ